MKHKEIIDWLSIFSLYLAVLLAVAYWGDSYPENVLKEQLISALPVFLTINFFMVVTGLILNFKAIKKILGGIQPKHAGLILFVVLMGFALSMFLAPRTHRIFYDETIYLNIGQNIAFQGKAGMCNEGFFDHKQYFCTETEFNKQPYAWPFLVGLVFKIFGTGETAAFVFNNFIFGFAIFIVFLIGYLLFRQFYPALFSSLVFALIPDNLRWSHTTSAELSASLFIGLAIFSALLFVRQKDLKSLFLLAVLLPFSVQFRMESILAGPLIFILIALEDKKVLTKKSLFLFGVLSFALLAAHMVHIYAVRGDSWGSTGARMDLSYLKNNLRTNALYYVNNAKFPLLFTLLASVGLVLKKDCLKERTFLAAWFICLWGIYLFFYAGSYGYGADVRYSLLSFMPLSLLAGMGMYRFETFFEQKKAIIIFRAGAASAVILSFLYFVPQVGTIGEEACQARADHHYTQKMAEMLPDNSLVLTHNPNMFLLLGRNAAQASAAYDNPQKMNLYFDRYKGGVFFHYNFWCNVSDPVRQKFCKDILDKYEHKRIAGWRERDYDFILYKLEQKAQDHREEGGTPLFPMR